MHSSALSTKFFFRVYEISAVEQKKEREKGKRKVIKTLTIRGPALKGVNIVGLATNFFMRMGSIHRSGSKLSASSPHNAGLRCIKRGKKTMVVVGGIYNG